MPPPLAESGYPALTVVLNWTEVERPCALLEALVAQGVPPATVLLVDNASPNRSGVRIQARFPGVALRTAGENLGFAGGMNLALVEALERGLDEVLLLNQDLLPAPGMVAALTRALRSRRDLAAVGPTLVDPAAPTAAPYGPYRTSPWTLSPMPVPQAPGATLVDAEWVTGAALLLRVAALAEVGLFDEDYFLYWEDMDLCHRLRSAGWRVGTAPAARAEHPGEPGAGSALAAYFMQRNRWLFLRKRAGGPGRLVRELVLALRALREAGRVALGRGGRAGLLGCWDGLRGVRGPGRLAAFQESPRR